MQALMMYATDVRKFGVFAAVSKKRRYLLRDSIGCDFCTHACKHFRIIRCTDYHCYNYTAIRCMITVRLNATKPNI